MPPPPSLREYQKAPYLAILRAAEAHDADIVVCRFSRQTGKNEISARSEGTLLATYRRQFRQGVKAAPTQNPQAVRSLARLDKHLRACGFSRATGLFAGSDHVRLGQAEWWFGSGEPGANVVGATADLLLEFDEAQAFDLDKHDRDYSPMAAATACARVYYGTAWTDFDLLEVMRQDALAREKRDGKRRAFDVPWHRVAEELPAYGLYVEAEMKRLGHSAETPHPTILTEYELVTMAGAGRLFNAAQLALLQGDHPRQDDPLSASHNTYVAGLDVGGANLSQGEDPDETVLTIARAQFPGRGRTSEPIVQVVNQYAWKGLDHDAARGEVLRLLRRWRVTHVTVDATGIGEPIATHLTGQLGERAVTPFKFTRASKSSLGYDLITAVNTSALKVWQPAGHDPGHAALTFQLQRARQERLPGQLIGWHVDERDGHDDRLVSLALALRAAQRGRPRVARTRGGA